MFVNSVDIREIKEVRVGTDSKDFDVQQVGLEKIDQFCFAVYYGTEFNLKTLSVAGEWLVISGFPELVYSVCSYGVWYMCELDSSCMRDFCFSCHSTLQY